MFAIFKNGKQVSEQVSTIEIANQLIVKHRREEPKVRFEIKAFVNQHNPSSTKKRRKWLTMEKYNEMLRDSENKGLF